MRRGYEAAMEGLDLNAAFLQPSAGRVDEVIDAAVYNEPALDQGFGNIFQNYSSQLDATQKSLSQNALSDLLNPDILLESIQICPLPEDNSQLYQTYNCIIDTIKRYPVAQVVGHLYDSYHSLFSAIVEFFLKNSNNTNSDEYYDRFRDNLPAVYLPRNIGGCHGNYTGLLASIGEYTVPEVVEYLCQNYSNFLSNIQSFLEEQSVESFSQILS